MRKYMKILVASLLLPVPGAPSSFLLLVVRPGAPSSVLENAEDCFTSDSSHSTEDIACPESTVRMFRSTWWKCNQSYIKASNLLDNKRAFHRALTCHAISLQITVEISQVVAFDRKIRKKTCTVKLSSVRKNLRTK